MTASAANIENTRYKIEAQLTQEYREILSPNACEFLCELHEKFAPRINELLAERVKTQQEIKSGKKLDFLPETKAIREDDWKVAPIPEDLQDRRVEITGPVERKMIINALNSGAKVYMADFEDSNTPSWENNIQGQINLRDAVQGTISFRNPDGKYYTLNEEGLATLIVRPRGLHLKERHFVIGGEQAYGALFDFGLFFINNYAELIKKGTGPYFYIPKLESHLEARLWSNVFKFTEEKFSLDTGTIKATVLIETINAVFEMDEILYEMKDYIVGLNCGRWDYIFSFIKKFSHDPNFVLPDRGKVTMGVHFLDSYSKLLVKICHRRGAFGMGGMAAYIPVKTSAEENEKALAAVRADKEREAQNGHDGTWVAHPGLISTAKEVFDKYLGDNKNQLDKQLNKQLDVEITAEDLLKVPEGDITEAGLRNNITVSIRYLQSWLGGAGCVPIFNLMEDAATAEIARTQIWQWIHHKAKLNDGREINVGLFKQLRDEELTKIKEEIGDAEYNQGHYELASKVIERTVLKDEFEEFLTLPAYEYLG